MTFAATDSLGVYGELAGITNGEDADGDEIIDWGTKVGLEVQLLIICYNWGVA